jgi:hypothetical protein
MKQVKQIKIPKKDSLNALDKLEKEPETTVEGKLLVKKFKTEANY